MQLGDLWRHNRDTEYITRFFIILKALSNKIIKKIRVIGTLRTRFNIALTTKKMIIGWF